jgi:hypothetical protein
MRCQKRVVTLCAVMLLDCPFADMSNAATVAVRKRDVSLLMEKIKNIF